jgi:NDP-sugar pyrophosphorylase family protein
MKGIILAAGKGTRLRPLTNHYQKTMIPVHNKPLLEYIIEGLIFAGLKKIIIVVGYQKKQIIKYFGTGKKWGIEIEYVEQKKLNGTGGALLLCRNKIKNSHFFLTWGDILVPYHVYKDTIDLYKETDENFILVANYTEEIHQGAAVYEKNNYLTKIIEKPAKGTSKTKFNNCGIFILSEEIFDVLENLEPSKRGEIEIPNALLRGIKEKGWKIRVMKLEKGTFRGDFGNIRNYRRLNEKEEWLEKIK